MSMLLEQTCTCINITFNFDMNYNLTQPLLLQKKKQ
jgi:hypothetical protein